MAKFLTGFALSTALERIVKEATDQIVLISPYIKLHPNIKSALLRHRANADIAIILVFGKNDDDISKSISREDIDFFTQFPNVRISHENRLHAKYYANEQEALITSMNLYEYSQNNNIEAGILIKPPVMGLFGTDGSLDGDAADYFLEVAENATLLFERIPEYDQGIAGTGLVRKYTRSIVRYDCLNDHFKVSSSAGHTPAPRRMDSSRIAKPLPAPVTKSSGYCIRTRTIIPFNIDRPLCEEGFKSWSRYSNRDYAEKFCHFSGEPSYGKNSFKSPVLEKNWEEARKNHGF